MNRVIDFAVTVSTLSALAYAGGLPSLRPAKTILPAGRATAEAAPRLASSGDAVRTGPMIYDVLAQSRLTAGASAVPLYFCPTGPNALHMSQSPIKERTTSPVMRPVSILLE